MEKIKPFITSSLESEKGKTILTILIVICVGLASFQLGRLSKNDSSTSGIKITYPPELQSITNQPANVLTATENLPKATSTIPKNSISSTTSKSYFFASKRGHKYYPAGCSAGKSIKQENRIYFANSTEAQNAGYELSSSCD